MKKFLQSGIWVFSSNLLIRIIALAITPILAKNFPKDDLSIFRSLQSIVLIVFTLIPMGTNLLYISEKKEEREKYWSLFLTVSTIVSLLAILVLYFMKMISYSNVPLFSLFVIIIPISSFIKNIYTTKFTESIMFKELSLGILLRQICLYSLIIIFTFVSRTLEYLIIALLVSEVIEVLLLGNFSRKLNSFFLDFKKKIIFDKKAKEFTIFTGGANTIVNLSLQLPSVLVLSLLGKNLAVEFQMPLVLVSIPVSLLVMSVTRVMFPYLSNNRELSKIQMIIYNTQYIFFIVGLPICFFMFYFANEITIFLFNPEWTFVVFVLKVLTISTFINILQNPLSQLCLIRNKPKIAFYYAIVLLMFRLIGLYLGYYIAGFKGTVISFALFDSIVRIVRLIIDLKLIEVSIKQYLQNILKPLIVSISLIGILIIGSSLEMNHYLLFVLMAIIYVLGLLILEKRKIYYIFNVLKNGMKNEG